MKKIGLIAFFSLFLLSGCMTLSLPDDWQEQRKQAEEEQKKQEEEDKTPAVLTYFAFLKEDNPDLEADIVCSNLEPQNLLMIPSCDLGLPRMLKPRFSVDKGALIYNGDEMVSGESEMYCSYAQNATIRIESGSLKTYHNVTFAPCTGLPVVEIYTEDEKKISSKEEWLNARLIIHGFGEFPDLEDSVFVKKRGNGTAKFPKVAFNLKFNKKRPVLGMSKHKRWCFLANYRDKSQIRNAVSFYLGSLADNLEWTPRSEFAEVFLNGKHEGIYQVTEQIRVGSSRVDIDELTESDVTDETVSGGYLMEIDKYFDEANKFKTTINEWPVMLKNPDEDVCQPEHFAYIMDFYNKVEALMERGLFDELYENYIDLDSFIDYYIVQTLTNNREFPALLSIFCYKKRNGKMYAGPLWDFDYSTYNATSGTSNVGTIWYKYLFLDSKFNRALKARWNELKPVFGANVYRYIAETSNYISNSVHIDEAVYPDRNVIMKNGDEDLSFEDAVDKLAEVLKQRIAWMDELIASF